MQPFLTITDLSFSVDQKTILSDVKLTLNQGQIATLLGPSGCGKTSLLRLIAGFSPPSSGTISLNGDVISTPTCVLPTEKRGIGMIFQDYALFPHLSVYDNLVFGLSKTQPKTAKQRVSELLDMVGLSGYENRYPHELSGGEQQRIAIARAVAPQPQLLLMDEPFASLDANLRERLVHDLGELLKTLNITTILVTHDQREAFAISEYIGLMNAGNVLQWDTPYQIYHEPNDPFVANFVGQGVMVRAKVLTDTAVDSALGVVQSRVPLHETVGNNLCMLIRPDDIVEDKGSSLSATIMQKWFHGANTLYELHFNGVKLVANLNSHADYAVGDSVPFAVKADHLVTFNHNNVVCECVC